MSSIKFPRKSPKCVKCGQDVVILVPQNELGNTYGEKWLCECGDSEKICFSN